MHKFKLNSSVFYIEGDKKIIATVIGLVVRNDGVWYKLSGVEDVIYEDALQPYKD